MTAVTERTRQYRAEQLVLLGQLESFGILREIGEEETLRRVRLMLARLNAEDTLMTLMQRQADYDRGFIAGVRYITVEVTAKAERKLKGIPEPEAEEIEWDRWSRDD